MIGKVSCKPRPASASLFNASRVEAYGNAIRPVYIMKQISEVEVNPFSSSLKIQNLFAEKDAVAKYKVHDWGIKSTLA